MDVTNEGTPMTNQSERIWVRSCQKPTAKLSPAKSIDFIGGNQGNLLYQFSTYRALVRDDVELETISYGKFAKGAVEERAEWINSECDRLVLPLSSSFRLQNMKNLDLWADLVERLTIPVTVVGIGAQLRLEDVRNDTYLPSRVTGIIASAEEIEQHEAAARRFVAAVLDRSASIGVRGEISKRYLQHLGFPADRIDAIGCPSLFTWGPDFQMPERDIRLNRKSKISLSFDHRIEESAQLLDQTITDYRRSTVYMQEKLGAQMVITGEDTRPDWDGDERFPVRTSHRTFAKHRMVYYPTAWSWIRHLEDADFSLGPRLHGTVAATLAGTSAHLLVHDSRTLEIADHHHLPHTLTDDLGTVRSAADLATRQDYTAFNASYRELFGRFTTFLERNSLRSAYDDPGAALEAFDASVEPAARAAGVVSAQGVPSSARERAGALVRRIRS
ncbi:hypothetical protein C6I20_04415 [Aeromicrobium sp. A1-2]|uniref:polysaccharide pyruvyl transferase family protein n=1 Tax=Aeromicrobium sp. A1-2 TaxID=2107713 RepID=UPI000E4BD0BB|nr:polysaccharide pyruvyl transferase family protein [Aeromicrobium sp. A1-2]AXT84513.1 hypothetical protein C6I20_04415 [Aeromicrobium sp. A1-2]